MDWQEWIKIIEKSRSHPLPGASAQFQMAPVSRRREGAPDSTYRNSAVMIALCQDHSDNPFIPLIVRNEYKGAHSGQVSFPGGKVEEVDENFEATAKRECMEEIGLSELETIRALTPLYIPVSNFLVHPFISLSTTPNPTFSINEREVNKVIRCYLNELLMAPLHENTAIKVGEITLLAPAFKIDNQVIWGATAMMLNEVRLLFNGAYETL